MCISNIKYFAAKELNGFLLEQHIIVLFITASSLSECTTLWINHKPYRLDDTFLRTTTSDLAKIFPQTAANVPITPHVTWIKQVLTLFWCRTWRTLLTLFRECTLVEPRSLVWGRGNTTEISWRDVHCGIANHKPQESLAVHKLYFTLTLT